MKQHVTWPLAVIVAICALLSATFADESRRILRFPSDRAVGAVYWRMPDGKPYTYAMYSDQWRPIGRTRGTVRLPAKAEVRLNVGKTASRDLTWLDDLGPDDVQALNLYRSDVRDEALRPITRLTGLRAIQLQSTRITDAALEGFDSLTNLEEIDLGAFAVNRDGFGVGDGAMRVLGRLPKLRNVQLRLTKVSDAGLAELAKCQSLTILDLSGTRVSDAGLVHLTKLPHLETLRLGISNEGTNVTDEGLKTVGKLSELTWLDLSSTTITGRGLAHLSGLKKLKTLALDSTDVMKQIWLFWNRCKAWKVCAFTPSTTRPTWPRNILPGSSHCDTLPITCT